MPRPAPRVAPATILHMHKLVTEGSDETDNVAGQLL